MSNLTILINESGQSRSQTFSLERDTKIPGVIQIGRNSQLCDLVLQDKKVSRLHAQIFFKSDQKTLYIQNLTVNNTLSNQKPNFLSVNGQSVVHQKVPITTDSLIQLGKVELRITLIDQPQNVIKCPNGHLISYSYQGYFCPHCGNFLESGGTVAISNFQHL